MSGNPEKGTIILLVQKRLPVLAVMDNTDDEKVILLDPIDDQVRATGMKPDRGMNIRMLPGHLGVIAQDQERFVERADVGFSLIWRPHLCCIVPDAVQIG